MAHAEGACETHPVEIGSVVDLDLAGGAIALAESVCGRGGTCIRIGQGRVCRPRGAAIGPPR